jgi:hypothetical protein
MKFDLGFDAVGEPLPILRGLSGSRRDWRGVACQLAAGHR